jgi:hypothetical protein
MLGNRKVLMTFSGWYNLYDANWPTTLADRGTMLAGRDNALELMRNYGVNYAIFNNNEIQSGEANLNFFRQHFLLEYDLSGWYIFNLERPADSVVE